MIYFEWPWLLLALPLPWLVRHFMKPVHVNEEAALRVPFIQELSGMTTAHEKKRKHPWPLWLAVLTWCLFIMASMRPQWLGDLVEIPVSGRDLMLIVDISGSMRNRDFVIKGQRVNRLIATKYVAGEFIDKRAGDRIGLILYGDKAYLQAPLTFDRQTVKTLLDEAAIGLAGIDYTAIGDSIGLAIKRLREQQGDDSVLILLTDGKNNSGVDPLEAAELAAREGLKIYTIGIGTEPVMLRGFMAMRGVPTSDLDELALKNIADKTGGQYFRARDSEELQQIYAVIDQLEPTEQDAERFRPRKALYVWPLAIASLLSVLLLLMKLKGRL